MGFEVFITTRRLLGAVHQCCRIRRTGGRTGRIGSGTGYCAAACLDDEHCLATYPLD